MAGGTCGTCDSTGVWMKWAVITSGTSDSTTTAINDSVWCEWNSSTTSATCTSDCWYAWNGTVTTRVSGSGYKRFEPPPETAEQREARLVRERAAEEERKAREAERTAAAERATKLLVEHLNEEQRQQFEKEKKFHVVSADGNRYEIDCRRHHGNVNKIVDGKAIENLCVYAPNVPLGDNYLAQKLAIEANEEEFRKRANVMRLIG